MAIISALESNVFTKKDFIRTDSYVMRLTLAGTGKLIDKLNAQFTSKVEFKSMSGTPRRG